MIHRKDRDLLRELALEVAEICARPEMPKLRHEWVRHNALVPGRPMILVYPEGSWTELLPASSLRCEDPVSREVEYKLRARLLQHRQLGDDMVFEPEFLVPRLIDYTTFLPDRTAYATTTFCFHTGLVRPVTGWELDPVSGFIPQLWEERRCVAEDPGDQYASVLGERSDLASFSAPRVRYRERDTLHKAEAIHECIGAALNVRVAGIIHCSFHLASTYCSLRGGMMNMLYDLADQQELLLATMDVLRAFNLELLRQYAEEGYLELNNRAYLQSTGGLSCTDQLPAAGFEGRVRPRDMWASCESQELSHVSPRMHQECVMRFEQDLLAPFGLTGYGCCEPLENKLEYLLGMRNLRRISCSPFAEVAVFRRNLSGRAILSWKPDPSMIARDLTEQEVEPYLRSSVREARGSQLEIVLKDTHTCGSQPGRFARWMRVMREVVEEEWPT